MVFCILFNKTTVIEGASSSYEYVGCFSHQSQSLIETWSEKALRRRDCETFARRRGSEWFVLEYPQGFDGNRASCGVGGHIFMNDGQVYDEDCLFGQEYYGNANKFALYSSRRSFVRVNVSVDTVAHDFVVFRNESINMAVNSFIKRFQLEGEPGVSIALTEMARMRLSDVTLGVPTREELKNSYISTKSEKVSERLGHTSKLVVADDLLGEAKMVRCVYVCVCVLSSSLLGKAFE
mgnify:CR=1 FL=1